MAVTSLKLVTLAIMSEIGHAHNHVYKAGTILTVLDGMQNYIMLSGLWVHTVIERDKLSFT